MTDMSLDWRMGGWHTSQRRYITDQVVPAIEIAEDYIGNVLGVDNSVRSVGVYRGERGPFRSRGGSVSDDRIELFFTEPEYRYHKLGNLFGEITTTVVHEGVHSARAIYNPELTYAELVVTEGLAHLAQSWAEQDVFDIAADETILGTGLESGSLEPLLVEFLDDPIATLTVPNVSSAKPTPDEAKWFRPPKDGSHLSWGCCLAQVSPKHG